jgi:hypothetical protein
MVTASSFGGCALPGNEEKALEKAREYAKHMHPNVPVMRIDCRTNIEDLLGVCTITYNVLPFPLTQKVTCPASFWSQEESICAPDDP